MSALEQEVRPSTFKNLDWDVLWERYGIATVLLIGWILAILFVPKFSNPDNMLNVIRQSAFIGCAAVGMTIAIISGKFDLSVGSTLALSAYLGVMVAARTEFIPFTMLASLLTGMAVGVVNGQLVTRLKIPAFIATLGMYFIVRGLSFIISKGGQPVRYSGKAFTWWGNGEFFGVPTPFLVFILCALAGWFVLKHTSFGRYVFSIGTNSNAAKVAGVPVDLTIVLVFIVVGLFTGISAFLFGSRLYSAGPGLEPGFELTVISAVVLGGTRLAGGRGSMLGTVAACLLFATMGNVLNLIHADAFVQRVAVGVVLLLALSIEGIRQRLFERASRRVVTTKSVESAEF